MRAVDILRKKRDGGELSSAELAAFVEAAAHNGWPDYQLSALLMGICTRGMTDDETAALTRHMADSGRRIDLSDLPGPKVDKHSTGGVGDKTSLILAPLAAVCGIVVPMMSGRGLGHTGGTLDKLESIPGFRVMLSEREFRDVLRATGFGMIGQTTGIAPADKKLYALRDVTGTVENISLITASILSKKLAEGISGLVMDVKCGLGAFMKTRTDARELANSLVRVGTANGLNIEGVLTPMDAPLGRAIGNSLEMIEAIETLKGNGPTDVEELSVLLAASMVRLGGKADTEDAGYARVQTALASGAGVELFRRVIELQGGDPRVIDDYSRLPVAPKTAFVCANRSGIVTDVNAGSVGVAATVLGAGRERAEDRVDHSVGIIVRVMPGERVKSGDPVFEVRYRDDWKLNHAMPLLEEGFRVGDTAPAPVPRVLETIR